MAKKLDLTGQKFNRLYVIEHTRHATRKGNFVRCRCTCGKEKVILAATVFRGTTKSCGCISVENILANHYDNPKKPYGMASARDVWNTYRSDSRAKNREFAITFEQFIEITQKTCHYCGAAPKNIKFRPRHNGEFTYNGMDRIDSSKGYTLNNIVPCCKTCNRAKREMSYDDFIEWIDSLVSFRLEQIKT